MSKAVFRGLFLAVLVVAAVFRLGRLDLRPMHHDEANQAVKFGALLEQGEYHYDKADHHGPTLYYLTLPAARARGQKTLAETDERTLRVVPAVFGVGLILLFLLLGKGLGRETIVLAALLAALSPALTYFSRFYIQESLFAFFALGFLIALGKFALRPGAGWSLAAGFFGGLAYATKETSVIVFAAAGAALVLTLILTKPKIAAAESGRTGKASGNTPASMTHPTKITLHVLLGLALAAVIAAVLYSSFFRNPGGILESLRAFREYAARGTEAGLHAQPWSYYLGLLAFSKSGPLVWTEGLILILAGCGLITAIGRRLPKMAAGPAPGAEKTPLSSVRNEDRFWPLYILIYSLFAATAFSLLRYKTPWNLIPFYIGIILLAGFGAARLLKIPRSRFVRGLALMLILTASVHLGVQNWRANFVYPADERNPYVYAQTSPDFLRLVKRVRDIAAIHPEGKNLSIRVVAGPYEQWPLPWYLRDFPRVGYWTDPAAAGGFESTPIVIASVENADLLAPKLGDRFQVEFYGLRPGVLLTVFIDKPLWERFLKKKPGRQVDD
jgi:uncharacterized protein (TIGR03663 family)